MNKNIEYIARCFRCGSDNIYDDELKCRKCNVKLYTHGYDIYKKCDNCYSLYNGNGYACPCCGHILDRMRDKYECICNNIILKNDDFCTNCNIPNTYNGYLLYLGDNNCMKCKQLSKYNIPFCYLCGNKIK